MSPSRCSRPGSASPPSISTSRQQSFTHYIENRRDWAARAGIELELPDALLRRARRRRCASTRTRRSEFASFAEAVSAVEHTHDFVVIDTPGNDTYLMRLAHSMADTLITPLNDSFVDFDVLGTCRSDDFEVTGVEPLCRDGARSAPPAPPGRRRADRLGRGAQPAVARSDRATSGWSARASTGWRGARLSLRSTALPSALSIASSFRAA